MSSSKNREPGIMFQGIHGRYELAEKLGSGGNGEVYSVNLIDADETLDITAEYVIKRLNLTRIVSEKETSKRIMRFHREIEAVKQMQGQIRGLLPIFDHAADICDRNNEDWYLMPRAKEYCYGKKADPEKILIDAIDIGKTIKQIHSFGRAHRDIKPANILFYHGRPVLSDFGLVWRREDESITESGDHIGPFDIRPPELDYIQKINFEKGDYFNSDVYLFAKTVWIFLTGNKKGFKGEYTRGNPRIYLKDNLFQSPQCLEPLNVMLEKATKYDSSQRCSIEECIYLLEEELDILRERLSPQLLQQYMFNESVMESQSKIPPNESVYSDVQSVLTIITQLKGVAEVVVSEHGTDYNLGIIQSIDYLGGPNYSLRLKQKPKPDKVNSVMTLYVGIKHVVISNDKKCSIKIGNHTLFGDDIPSSSNIRAIVQMENTKVILTAELTIRLIPRIH